MITDPKQMQKMVDFARIAKQNGFTQQEVEEELNKKGSSLMEVGAFMQNSAITPEQPKKQESSPVYSGLQSVERGALGSFGINANKANALWDASSEYLGKQLAKSITGQKDIIPADSKYNDTGADREATWRDYYNRALNKEEAIQAAFEQKHPYMNIGLEIVGSTKGAGNLIGKALGAEKAAASVAGKLAPKVGEKIATVAGKAVGGAISGGAGGATYGFGTTNGDINERLKGALRGAKYGAAIGGLAPVVIEGGKEAVKGTSKLIAKALGATSGAGGASVEQAYDAGMRNSKVFKDAMRGTSEVYDVVDDANKAVRKMEQTASAKWQSMLPDQGKTIKLPEKEFNDALKTATDSISGIKSGVDDVASDAVNKIHKLSRNIKASGGLTFNNAQEAKEAVDGIIGSLSAKGEKNAVRLLMPIKNALTDTMEKAIPEYGGARAAYAADMNLINKIKKALTSKDPTTALRKLQGITRQSVAAAQGGKQALGKVLNEVSGGKILDAVAGGQLTEWIPRDAIRIGSAGGLALGFKNPVYAVAASPRLVGEGAYLLGRAASKAQPIVNAVGQKASKIPAYSLGRALGYITDDKSLD